MKVAVVKLLATVPKDSHILVAVDAWSVCLQIALLLSQGFLVSPYKIFPKVKHKKLFKNIRNTVLPPCSKDFKQFFQDLYRSPSTHTHPAPCPTRKSVKARGRQYPGSASNLMCDFAQVPELLRTSFRPHKVRRQNILQFGFWCSVVLERRPMLSSSGETRRLTLVSTVPQLP